jgi:hypothetical protein
MVSKLTNSSIEIPDDSEELLNLKEDHHQNSGKTEREYPERNKLIGKETDEYRIEIFASKSDYDLNDNVARKERKLKFIGSVNVDYHSYHKLWKFANEVFGVKSDNSNELDDADLSYQELADAIQCTVVVNTNLDCEFTRSIGETENTPKGFGGGSAQCALYYQRGMLNNDRIEDPKLRAWYHPNLAGSAEKMDQRIVQVYPPLDKDNFQFKTQMKKSGPRTYNAGPCLTCFRHEGRIWMMKGTGEKAYCKNKGMQKRRFDTGELDDYLDGCADCQDEIEQDN